MYELTPDQGDYVPVPVGADTVEGLGYWVYSVGTAIITPATGGTLRESGNSRNPFAARFDIPPHGWMLVGNPSGIWNAEIVGADVAFTYDSATGYSLISPSVLLPGQAALVYSDPGGALTVTPLIP